MRPVQKITATTLKFSLSVLITLILLIQTVDRQQISDGRKIGNSQSKTSDLRSLPASYTKPGKQKLPAGLSRSDWDSILEAHELAKYDVRPVGDVWQARNQGQQWVTTFDRRGFLTSDATSQLRPTEGWSWGLQFVSYGFGEEQNLIQGSARDVRTNGGELLYQWEDQDGQKVEEWYRNQQNGFEHGFTISERPGYADRRELEPLNLNLKVRGSLVAERAVDGKSIAFRKQSGGVAVTYSGLKVWDARGRELPAIFTAANADQIRITIDEREAQYPLTVDPVAQQAYLKASVHSQAGEEFGTAVAISGDTVVVGAPSDDSESRGINQPPSYTYSFDDSGTAFVFVRNGDTWTQQAHLKSSNSWTADRFGTSVAITGDTIVVGAPGESQTTDGVDGVQCLPPTTNPCGRANNFPVYTAPDVGAAYVFVRNGNVWTQQNYLKASNSDESDYFGYAVAIDGETIVVGAHYEDSAASLNGDQNDNSALEAGAAYVFLRSGTTWIQQAYLKASTPVANDQFGYAVAIHNNTVVVGAVLQGDGALFSGAAFVFERNGSTWSQQARFKAPNPAASDFFGAAVGVSNDRVVVGAQGEDTSGAETGAAFIYKKTGTTWSQEAYLKASTPRPDDNFGFAVAIQGDLVIVTASNENGTGLGAAYTFLRQGSNWVEATLLRADNTESFDRFGSAVGLYDDTAIIGARYEQSSATGVGGDGSNNALTQTGAAYMFKVNTLRVTASIVSNTSQIASGSVATIVVTLTNPDSISRTGTLNYTVPDGLILIPGSCDGAGGTCTFSFVPTTASSHQGVTEGANEGLNRVRARAGATAASAGNWTVSWNGLVPGNGALVISFQVQIGNQAASGTQFCISSPVPGVGNICFRVTAPLSGPGVSLPVESVLSPKPGSVLIYNLYTSGVNPAVNDTRLTISNTSQVNPVNVHLFFVDGSSCAVADQYVRLTQNQTLSMLASDVDPGVTGYVIAVATDDRGCPISQNDLIGESFVRFERGHKANLTAIGISALAGGLPVCNANSSTATLSFDGVSYNPLPGSIALDSIPSRANQNETMLILNRLGGDLTIGATRLSSLAGVLFDDVEMAQSFTMAGGSCQMIVTLGNNFPRTAPRFDTVIPAGRTGWLKLYQATDGAISGAVINHSTGGFNGGHNLHSLTTTSTASFTIPVFPAR